MAHFTNLTLTQLGRNLIARLLSEGGKLHFSQIGVGEGVSDEDAENRSYLVDELSRLPVQFYEVSPEGNIVVKARLSTDSIPRSFYHRELGLYALDGEDSVLIAYGNAMDLYDYIPATGNNAAFYKTIEARLAFNGLQTAFKDLPTDDLLTIEGFYTRVREILPEMVEDYYNKHGFLDAVAEAKESANTAQRAAVEADESKQEARAAAEVASQASVRLEVHEEDPQAHAELFGKKADKNELEVFVSKEELQNYVSKSQLEELSSSLVPPGTIAWFADPEPPDGWMVCDGTRLSSTAYPELYAAIRDTYGQSGNQFTLPDLRGFFIRSLDTLDLMDPNRAFGSPQECALEEKQISFVRTVGYHLIDNEDGAHSDGAFTPYAYGNALLLNMGTSSGGVRYFQTIQRFSLSYVANTSTETRPYNIALQAIIKY